MTFRHTFCQSCDAKEEDGDGICQLCNDLCNNCCLYGGEHPPRNCPDKTCDLCSPHCEWCVYKNHTEKQHPGKTYNGELPMKCHHVGKTRLEQTKEELLDKQKRIRDTEDSLKRLRDERDKLQLLVDEQNGIVQKKRKQVVCKSCGNEGHNRRTCSNK